MGLRSQALVALLAEGEEGGHGREGGGDDVGEVVREGDAGGGGGLGADVEADAVLRKRAHEGEVGRANVVCIGERGRAAVDHADDRDAVGRHAAEVEEVAEAGLAVFGDLCRSESESNWS